MEQRFGPNRCFPKRLEQSVCPKYGIVFAIIRPACAVLVDIKCKQSHTRSSASVQMGVFPEGLEQSVGPNRCFPKGREQSVGPKYGFLQVLRQSALLVRCWWTLNRNSHTRAARRRSRWAYFLRGWSKVSVRIHAFPRDWAKCRSKVRTSAGFAAIRSACAVLVGTK